MNTKLHLRSVALGLVLGAALAFGIAASSDRAALPGRFQISAGAAHAFVLDTATGQVWEKFTPESGGNTSPGFGEPKTK